MDLPSSYRVAHGLRMGKRRKDIDHVVLGPSGVWVIDSKHWSGELTAGKGTLWRGRTPIRKETDSVEEQAAYARQVLGLTANPVLCFIGTRLPRPAQMVGRARVISLEALVPHIEAGDAVLTEAQVDAAFDKVRAWRKNPPEPEVRRGETPKPATSGRSPGRAVLRFTMMALIVLFVTGAVATTGVVALRALWNTFEEDLTPTAGRSGGSTTTTLAGQDLFATGVTCPAPGSGYTIDGRAANVSPGRIRVTSTIAGEQTFLGELTSFLPIEPLTGLVPDTTVRFDVESIDASGQSLYGYFIEVVTPAAPC